MEADLEAERPPPGAITHAASPEIPKLIGFHIGR